MENRDEPMIVNRGWAIAPDPDPSARHLDGKQGASVLMCDVKRNAKCSISAPVLYMCHTHPIHVSILFDVLFKTQSEDIRQSRMFAWPRFVQTHVRASVKTCQFIF